MLAQLRELALAIVDEWLMRDDDGSCDGLETVLGELVLTYVAVVIRPNRCAHGCVLFGAAAAGGDRLRGAVNFPKAEAVTEITALAEHFHAAAAELDELATNAPVVYLGTLRRQAYAVRVQVAQVLTEGEGAHGST